MTKTISVICTPGIPSGGFPRARRSRKKLYNPFLQRHSAEIERLHPHLVMCWRFDAISGKLLAQWEPKDEPHPRWFHGPRRSLLYTHIPNTLNLKFFGGSYARSYLQNRR